MALTTKDLYAVYSAVFEARTKWYDIGLGLTVPVDTLDSIKSDAQFHDHGEKLRETLKVWLEKYEEARWRDIVDVLKGHVIGLPRLAGDIEAKYCTTSEPLSVQTMPKVQQPHPIGENTHGLQSSRSSCVKEAITGKLIVSGEPHKMLLIGETGSGKTSFLNLIYNCGLVQALHVGFAEGIAHFHGFNDIKLENVMANKRESKTSNAKLYNVELCGLKMGVVDTPGFGGSRGIEEDERNVRRIIDALKEEEYLNCVCLIINGRQSHMSATLRYVLTEFTSILPREIVSNVIVVFTNTADPLDLNFDPNLLKIFFGREIEDSRMFYIENPYCRFEKAKKLQGKLPRETVRSLQKSFDETSEVLREMTTTMKNFRRVHTSHFATLYQKKQEVEVKVNYLLTAYENQKDLEKQIEKAEAEATSALQRKELNTNFRSTQRIKRWKVVQTDCHNTLCGAAHCHSNCHAPCYCISKSFDKEVFKRCQAMGGSNTCKQCGHSYNLHYHNNVRYEEEVYTKEFVDNEMKKKFEEARTMEERATIFKQELRRKREAMQRERQQLSGRLLLTLEEFHKLAISRNYAKLLESQLAVVQHRLEGSVGPETVDLVKTKEEIEKKLQLVATTLKQ